MTLLRALWRWFWFESPHYVSAQWLTEQRRTEHTNGLDQAKVASWPIQK